MDQQQLLEMPLKELGFSKKFLEICALMQQNTLEDLFHEGPRLVQNKYFSYLWLEELVAFLNENKLLHLLQPTPGNILH